MSQNESRKQVFLVWDLLFNNCMMERLLNRFLSHSFGVIRLHLVLLFGTVLISVNPALAVAGSCRELFKDDSSFLTEFAANLKNFEISIGLESNKPYVPFETAEDIGPFSSVSSYGWRDPKNQKTQFLLSPHDYHPIFGIKKPVVLPEVQIKNEYPEFQGQQIKWIDNENKQQSYRLVNIGFSQLRRDWPALENIVTKGLESHPTEPLLVTIPSQMVVHRDRLVGWQKWASQKATDTYAKRKEYLDRDDLFSLRDFDTSWHRNDEYFVLLKDSGISSYEMTPKQFDLDALVIIRLARLHQHSGFIPRSWWKATSEHLPVTDRFAGTPVGDLLHQSINRIDKYGLKRVAEISRFVRFQEFPEPIMDAFLKNLFEVAVDKANPANAEGPIDAFVISVDRKTRRLFKSKYRFQDLARLNSPDSESPEFLMVLRTDSQEFRETYADFQNATASVQVKPIPNSLDSRKSSVAWNNPDRWHEGSSEEKGALAEMELVKARAEVRSRLFAASLPLVTAERAKQIATWIATESTIPKTLQYKLDRLSQVEKVELFNKGIFFSTLFKELIKRISQSFPTSGKLLIVSEGPEPFQSLIAPQLEGRDVSVVSPNELKSLAQSEFDAVILFGTADSATVEIAQAQLRSKGTLITYKHFTENQNFSLLKTLINYAQDILRNGAPLTESELALELAQRRLFYDTKGEKPRLGWYNPTSNDAQIYYGISTSWVKP